MAATIRTVGKVLEAVQARTGMANSYNVALEKGTTIIGIGTRILGERVGSS
jgi:uncharacterized pyridoxal phosphate-containing UPF0001 family protein